MTHFRKTAKGELLLELKKAEDMQTSDFQQKVKTVLKQEAEVRAVTHTVLIAVKDMDEIITKEKVRRALTNKGSETHTNYSSQGR